MGYMSGLEAPEGYVEVYYGDVDTGYMADFHRDRNPGHGMTLDELELLGKITKPGTELVFRIEQSTQTLSEHLQVYKPS